MGVGGGSCYVNRLMHATAVRAQSDNIGTGTIYLNMSGPNIIADILRNVLNIIIT